MLALLVNGCTQLHYYAFANCTSYDVRTSHMPWNPVHRMTICYDADGAHYFSETATMANITDLLAAPVGNTVTKINPLTPGAP